jgi:hypothetical protein
MSNQEAPPFEPPPGRDIPDPAREALDQPHLTGEELKREIGDSEVWDEASEETGSNDSDEVDSADKAAT